MGIKEGQNNFLFGKKGQGLSTSAIILIILGVIILVILALGFIVGWNNLKFWVNSDENNIDTISLACQSACTTRSSYDFCTKVRDLEIESDKFSASCYTFGVASEFSQYGFEDCSDINCETLVSCNSWNYKKGDDTVMVKGQFSEEELSSYCTVPASSA